MFVIYFFLQAWFVLFSADARHFANKVSVRILHKEGENKQIHLDFCLLRYIRPYYSTDLKINMKYISGNAFTYTQKLKT